VKYTLPTQQHRPLSVLLVDDDTDLLQELSEALESVGSVVFRLPDPSHLNCSSLEVFDVVVLDIAMPGADGFEVISRISSCTCKPALVLQTGFGIDVLHSARQAAEMSGIEVRGTFTKPVDIGALALALLPGSGAPPLHRQQTASHSPEAVAGAMATVLDDGAAAFCYQPKVNVASGICVGFEVLFRDSLPGLGKVRPSEQADAICATADLALRVVRHQIEAAAGLAQDSRVASSCLTANINLPLEVAVQPGFADMALYQCGLLGLEPGRIVFELLERSAYANDRRAVAALARLRLRGFGIALDDVGQSESGLLQLSSLPLTEIKIDGELIRQARLWPKSAEIVMAICALGHRLSMKVTAEAVETKQDLRLLRGAGVDAYQGYLAAPKLEAEALLTFVESHSGRADEPAEPALTVDEPDRLYNAVEQKAVDGHA
jgi:EAL domain-containing protein (putative c-di-GMP-specific phosphodiesterase class I)/ActR/RegA family two-component response regulator